VYIEKFLQNIRHIEVQILGDGEKVLHLGERECTIQRRNQKLIEESPSPALTNEQRKAIAEAAVQLAEAVSYTSAGTVEFILDSETGQFYFIEMNTRIQVEHPVTEMITGFDLVKAQIMVAQGESLTIVQEDINFSGHAIECRINAEDPDHQFMPCPGPITHYVPAGGPGIRIDSHLFSGYNIPAFYDSLVAKIIAWGENRTEALSRMKRALEELKLEGVQTTLPLHQKILQDRDFQKGLFNTHFIETFLSKQVQPKGMVTHEK
jgi:acetyl-CoA carboxylase biotin carboxylase subunit